MRHTNLMTILVPVALSAFAAACGDASDVEIAATPLAGTVGGKPWTFALGTTNAFLSEGDPDFFAELYMSTFTACGFGSPNTEAHLIVSVPKEPGDYGFGTERNMTFSLEGNDNLITLEGHVVVDSVTDTKVTGGLYGTYDGDNEVNGRFELAICAE